MVYGILAMVAGVACLIAAALAWCGRWRRWSRQFLWSTGAMAITVLPGLGAAMLAAGLNKVGVISASSTAATICFLLLVAGVLLSFTTPRWWGPRWCRARDQAAPPDLDDPVTALVTVGVRRLAARGVPPSPRSQAPRRLGRPLQRCVAAG